jgi:hypothetical protein
MLFVWKVKTINKPRFLFIISNYKKQKQKQHKKRTHRETKKKQTNKNKAKQTSNINKKQNKATIKVNKHTK